MAVTTDHLGLVSLTLTQNWSSENKQQIVEANACYPSQIRSCLDAATNVLIVLGGYRK